MKKKRGDNFFYSPIFFKFLKIGIVFGLLVALMGGVISYKQSQKKIIQEMDMILQKKVSLIDDFVDGEEREYFSIYDEELFLTFLKMEENDTEYNLTKYLILEHFNSFENKSLGLINSFGVFILDKEEDLIGFNINSYPESVKYLERAGPEITYRVLPHPLEDTFHLLLPKKMYDESGEFAGVFSYRVLDDRLKLLLEEIEDFGDLAEGYLINRDFVLITPSKYIPNDAGVVVQIVNTSNSLKCLNDISSLGKKQNEFVFGDVEEYKSYWGGEVIGRYVAMNKLNWCLFLEFDKSDFLRKSIASSIFEGVILFISIILFFGLFSYFKYKNFLIFS